MEKIICLDSGHGWDTIGKQSPDFDKDGFADLKENEFNDAIVNKLAYALYKANIPYIIVSPDWRDTPLSIRTKTAINAAKGKQGIYISIHADAFTSSQANGTTIFKFIGAKHKLAELFHKHIAGLTRTDRKIKEANFQVLRDTNGKMDSILIEFAFMTNPDDLILLKSDKVRNEYVDKLLNACKEWYETTS